MSKLRCENCRGEFELDERSAREAGGRVECRYCGAAVLVAKAENAMSGSGEGDALEQLLVDICEPGAQPLPVPKSLLGQRESQPRPMRPAPKEPGEVVTLKTAQPTPEAVPPPAETERPPESKRPARMRPSYTISKSATLDPERLVSNRVVGFFPGNPEMEPYRVLRTRVLQAAKEKGGNAIMVTSAFPGEGKTLTAINLALTFAKGYSETALLVDCDLRRQKVCDVLGFDGQKGLGNYLSDDCSVTEMLTWPGVEKLVVVSGGPPVSESSELLGSPGMKQLVEEMKGRYANRYVFFDVPAVLAGADALAFAPLVDHILFVVRAGVTPLQEARRALEMLPREKVTGIVFNDVKEK
jgi:non-specific protein-tyrosine kinase